MPWICEIYDHRPRMCRDYPEEDSPIPDSCGYYFADGQRKGRCRVECDAACCRASREGGEPEGRSTPAESGGLPCKYIRWVDDDELPEERREALEKEREE